MNRHQKRAALAIGSALPATMSTPGYTGPTPTIRVLLIDGKDRSIKQIIMPMSPESFRKVLGERPVKWAKLGEIDERIHIMLAGDTSEQTVDVGHRWFEQEFEVANADGELSPVLHGKAVVFGFAPALKKAASTPVNPVWLQERVTWLEPGAARRARLEENVVAAALEAQPGHEEGCEEPRGEGLPALPAPEPDHG